VRTVVPGDAISAAVTCEVSRVSGQILNEMAVPSWPPATSHRLTFLRMPFQRSFISAAWGIAPK